MEGDVDGDSDGVEDIGEVDGWEDVGGVVDGLIDGADVTTTTEVGALVAASQHDNSQNVLSVVPDATTPQRPLVTMSEQVCISKTFVSPSQALPIGDTVGFGDGGGIMTTVVGSGVGVAVGEADGTEDSGAADGVVDGVVDGEDDEIDGL